MVAPTNANGSLSINFPGYDPQGHQVNVALRLRNVALDTSVTPNVAYGDLSVSQISAYPVGALPITETSGIVANAVASASFPVAEGLINYLAGFSITGSGATVGLPVTVTLTGLVTGTLSFVYCATAGSLIANTPLFHTFVPALPASAVETAIAISCPALGLGNTMNVVNMWGYQL